MQKKFTVTLSQLLMVVAIIAAILGWFLPASTSKANIPVVEIHLLGADDGGRKGIPMTPRASQGFFLILARTPVVKPRTNSIPIPHGFFEAIGKTYAFQSGSLYYEDTKLGTMSFWKDPIIDKITSTIYSDGKATVTDDKIKDIIAALEQTSRDETPRE